jgi:TfoX/Sxy family transcriptional regulator of competence genes
MAYSEELAIRLRAALRQTRGLEEKKMFGGIGFLVNGNMACGVHGQNLIVRLGSAEYEAALQRPHVKVFDMSGRPMSGWIFVEKDGYASEAALKAWIEKSLKLARSLPPK